MTKNLRHEPVTWPSRLETRFGEFTIQDDQVIAFPVGVPGFESCRHFVLLSSPHLAPLQCLQALDGQPASFLAIDPRLVLPDYRCTLSDTDRVRLQAEPESVLLWLAVVTASATEAAYVNLRAPIVINPARMLGFQLMPSDSLYPLRHFLDE